MTIPARAMHVALHVFCFCMAHLTLGPSFIYLTFNDYLLIARHWAYNCLQNMQDSAFMELAF